MSWSIPQPLSAFFSDTGHTSNSHMRVGSYSTGILTFRHREQRRFWGIPRVQPRTLTLLTPTSNAKSLFGA